MDEQRPISLVQWPAPAPSGSTALAHLIELIGPGKRVLATEPLDPPTRAALLDVCRSLRDDPGTPPGGVEVADVLLLPQATAGAVAALPDRLELLAPDGLVVIRCDNPAHVDRILLTSRGGPSVPAPTWHAVQAGIDAAGLVLLDVRRILAPVFHGGLGLDPATLAPELVAAALEDPEAETLTFVACAVRHGARSQVDGLAARLQSVQATLDHERTGAAHRLAAADVELSIALAHLGEVQTRAEQAEQRCREHEAHIEALLSTRTYRMAAPLRAAYARLRSR